MPQRTRTIVLAVALAAVLLSLAFHVADLRWAGNNQGYSPMQPVAYSHRVHAGEQEMDCLYCHGSAERSRHAGIPAVNVCMNCHRAVDATKAQIDEAKRLADAALRLDPGAEVSEEPDMSSEIRKIFDAMALDANRQPLEGRTPRSIRWIRVHHLPDYAYFDHRAHVTAGLDCQRCHGPVESMERVRQYSDLSMGWCVNCHREVNEKGVEGDGVEPANASLDCAACHY